MYKFYESGRSEEKKFDNDFLVLDVFVEASNFLIILCERPPFIRSAPSGGAECLNRRELADAPKTQARDSSIVCWAVSAMPLRLFCGCRFSRRQRVNTGISGETADCSMVDIALINLVIPASSVFFFFLKPLRFNIQWAQRKNRSGRNDTHPGLIFRSSFSVVWNCGSTDPPLLPLWSWLVILCGT